MSHFLRYCILLAGIPAAVLGQAPRSSSVASVNHSAMMVATNPNLAAIRAFKTPTFQARGKELLDPCGARVVLKGINKLAVFDQGDPFGAAYFPEIAKTGANCVRISWEMNADETGQPNPLSRLDQLITNAVKSKLIPIVGLWDFTELPDGGFSHLPQYVAYWQQPAVLAIIQKHQRRLIINIANEAATGDENNPADLDVFATAYKNAVQQLRGSGINVPLMIDGMDRGKSLLCFAQKGPALLQADPRHNLIFSFHPYWPKTDTDAQPTFIASAFAAVSPLAICVVMGELAGFGAGNSPCLPSGQVDYVQFAQRAETAGMGWLLWEWGPKVDGNGNRTCLPMDLTANGTFQSLMAIKATDPNGWARNMVLDAPFGIQKSAQKTFFIKNGFISCPLP